MMRAARVAISFHLLLNTCSTLLAWWTTFGSHIPTERTTSLKEIIKLQLQVTVTNPMKICLQQILLNIFGKLCRLPSDKPKHNLDQTDFGDSVLFFLPPHSTGNELALFFISTQSVLKRRWLQNLLSSSSWLHRFWCHAFVAKSAQRP